MNKVLLVALASLALGAQLLACGCNAGKTAARPQVTKPAGK